MKRASQLPSLDPPEDKSITTLYVGNIAEHLTEKDIRDHFYQYGEIRNITLVSKQLCAFIQFTKRSSAELAAQSTFNKLVLGGQKLSIKWAHSQAKQQTSTATKTNRHFENPHSQSQHPQMAIASNDYFNLAPTDAMPPGLKLPSSAMSMQSLYQNSAYTAPYSSIPLPPNANNMQIPPPPINESLHYPSQDPNRLGSIKK